MTFVGPWLRPGGRRSWLRLGLLGGALLVVGGGGTAAACKLTSLDCHLNPSPSLPNIIQAYEGRPAKLAVLASDLTATTVAHGFTYPTDFVFLPDGKILVAEKAGLIKLVSHDGTVAKQPFLDLRPRVDHEFFRGIVDLTLDPDFSSNHFLWVVYAGRVGGVNTTKAVVVRVARFTVRGDGADPASEKVIVGTDGSRPCLAQPATADCLPSELDVDGADIAFAPDGTLFISTGYGGGFERVERSAMLAEDVDTLGGKILHVDRDGHGVPGNPFWNGDPNANRSKVWATGFRNPFRLSLLPGSPPTLAVGDVGWDNWESLVRVTSGSDDGWPCYEARARTHEYRATAFCAAYYRRHPTAPATPWVAVPHPQALTMIAGPPLEQATALPPRLRGDLVYADWGQGNIVAIPLADVHAPPKLVLAKGAGGPDRFRIGPDGALYYLAANEGQLRRIAATSRSSG